MATHREIELKYSLTENEYRRIRRQLAISSTVRFTNTFFDTPKFLLRQNGIGCRIRSITGRAAILTVKYGGGVKGGLHNRMEIECALPAVQARRIVGGKVRLAALGQSDPLRVLHQLLGAEAIEALGVLGSLSTTRTKFRFSNLVGELDRCRLGQSYFHELEVESDQPKQADQKTRAWFEKRGIPVRPESRTKLSRFFGALI